MLRAMSVSDARSIRRTLAAYRGVVHHLRTASADEAASQLELSARQQGSGLLETPYEGPPRGYYDKPYRPAYNQFSATGPRPGGQALTGYGEVNESRTGWTV